MEYQVFQFQPHILVTARNNRSDRAMLAGPRTKMKYRGDCSPQEGHPATHGSHVQKGGPEAGNKPDRLMFTASLTVYRASLSIARYTAKAGFLWL